MSGPGTVGQPLGVNLREAGWRQGALFTAPALQLVAMDAAGPDAQHTHVQFTRNLKSKEKCVLVTQDCDLVAREDEEPHVEALVCSPYRLGSRFLTSIDRNSARYFLIDPTTGLVAQAKYRLLLTKHALQPLSPTPWPSSLKRFNRFVQWLARRYDRPAIPNAMVNALQKPVEHVLAQLDQEHPSLGAALSRAVHEVRVNLPDSEEPPFRLQLVFLVRVGELSEAELQAIDTAADAIWQNVDRDIVHLLPEHRILSPDQMTLAEYQATRPLYLEYLSLEGDEQRGAEPMRRL